MPGRAREGSSLYSLIVPVYRNQDSIPDLLEVLRGLHRELEGRLEVVLVVDGSPDASASLLREQLPKSGLRSRLLLLSRNFGSFPAIRAGLAAAEGPYFAVMAADLQEPPELMVTFFRALESEPVEVVVGTRSTRGDPMLSRWASRVFWRLYRRLVQSEVPPGGVDVFGCTRTVRDHLLGLEEANTTLVGLLFWLGFPRKLVPYDRRPRLHGRSAWTWNGRLRYLTDSIFAFSDLPIRLLILAGVLGLVISITFAIVVLILRLSGLIPVPGYSGTVLTITFFAALNSLGLGILGSYLWRAFENTKGRPESVVMARYDYGGEA
ncbi:MAG: glycosyltransferase family 2 protein [Myxococcota bacterium]